MFEKARIIANEEHAEFVKQILDKHEEEIRRLLENSNTRLGEGRTADVCFIESNKQFCLKIFKKPEQIKEVDFYLIPIKEKAFLEKTKSLGAKARVPKVYASFEDNDKEGHDFLMMETLPAVSVDDVLQGRAELPKSFDLTSFYKDLMEFVEKMHRNNVYHRDLHEGNIMIDKTTGQTYVIDFGAANEFWGEVERGERGPYHITKDGQDIILTSDEVMVRKVVKKLREALTPAK